MRASAIFHENFVNVFLTKYTNHLCTIQANVKINIRLVNFVIYKKSFFT